MPEMLGDETRRHQHAINGLLSLTPDGFPILGETPEVAGLWSVAAVWIKEGPGIGRMVAEWMTDGAPEMDPVGSDIARFYRSARTKSHIQARTREGFNKTYGIVHPGEQWAIESQRAAAARSTSGRRSSARSSSRRSAGSGPTGTSRTRKLLDEYGDARRCRANEWDARWWSPIINAEHLAMRERVGMVDLSAFAIFDIAGPGALDYVQKMAVAQMDVPVGRVVYTSLLNDARRHQAPT